MCVDVAEPLDVVEPGDESLDVVEPGDEPGGELPHSQKH